MNKALLMRLADERVGDATVLLGAGRWSSSYYLTGYAVELGLKACVLAHVERTGAIFRDRKFSEKCWTHDFKTLLDLAGLKVHQEFDNDLNKQLTASWLIVDSWSETSRYEEKTEFDARELLKAVTDDPDGVLPWIKAHW